jgi:hypothetical protein
MSYFNQHRDSSRSERERGPGECVILRWWRRFEAWSCPASDGTEAGQTMVSVAGALVSFANSLLRLQVGRDACTGEVQTAMARRGCFSTRGVGLGAGRPYANVQSPLHEGFRCWTTLALLLVLYCSSKWILAKDGVPHAADEATV